MNAPLQIKDNLTKEIIFESDVIIDGNSKMECAFKDKKELYVFLNFWSRLTK